MVQVKICGIRTVADALAAIDAGADMLGFNFYARSKRYLTPEDCKLICEMLAAEFPAIIRIGVFVNTPPDEIRTTLHLAHLNLAQLHGDEPLHWLAQLGDCAYKAVRLPIDPDQAHLDEIQKYGRITAGTNPGLLVDAAVQGSYGGTGALTDWHTAAELALHTPILLAGGLTPENVRTAVQQVRPWGVDTASGVEKNPGEKDIEKMKSFVRAVRGETG